MRKRGTVTRDSGRNQRNPLEQPNANRSNELRADTKQKHKKSATEWPSNLKSGKEKTGLTRVKKRHGSPSDSDAAPKLAGNRVAQLENKQQIGETRKA